MSLKIDVIQNSTNQNIRSNSIIETNIKSFVSTNLDPIKSNINEVKISNTKFLEKFDLITKSLKENQQNVDKLNNNINLTNSNNLKLSESSNKSSDITQSL